jgi:hypothetical protein
VTRARLVVRPARVRKATTVETAWGQRAGIAVFAILVPPVELSFPLMFVMRTDFRGVIRSRYLDRTLAPNDINSAGKGLQNYSRDL